MKLLFLTVIPSPYQRQLFSTIASSGEVEIKVFYYASSASDRQWKRPDFFDYERVLPGYSKDILGATTYWNPSANSEVKKFAPDVVIVSDYSSLTAQVVMRGLAKQDVPMIYWGEVPGFSKRGAIGRKARQLLQTPLRRAAAIAGIGEVAVEAYEKLFPDKPTLNIPYFCDLEPFQQARSKATRNKQTVDVLFSGQMIERKGVDILLAAFDRIARRRPNLRLVLLGNGPEKERYYASVLAELRDRVLFLGHKDPEDLPSVFASADIFCLPSRHDGWGVVVNEALGAGLPIVVSDAVGAGRDLVSQGVNGFITPAQDARALSKALEKLAIDPDLRCDMARASSLAAKSWGVDEGARRWIAAAREVLSRRRQV
ncbi:glycosyltransferase family 4 protein [Marivita geojedonensis]|uniref:Glycosyl transferase family 1 domain-containing protein n=1 Tax=Marivita geojedonensis TaxID=1123756 RepID=A0A1X4NRB4_9RHOB|nr:glycosyltransferase family 4 protein [Marivita geojedonensis]OSQ53505.1 hypothetical protein MGEO_02990 [Marivita geojedonensis]PRY81488.1 glycosyl transferase family 1 [Marivita geojedonensis]